MEQRWLVIGEAPALVEKLAGELSRRSPHMVCEHAGWDAQDFEGLSTQSTALVVPIIGPEVTQSTEFLQQLRCKPLRAPILAVLSDRCDSDLIGTAAELTDDFIVLPVHDCELLSRLTRLVSVDTADAVYTRNALTEEIGLAQLLGREPAFLQVIKKIPLVAHCQSPVLISGETGTGKELCAHAIHHVSARRNQPFIPIDCATLPDHLFENEVFGHSRGAYTDAHRDQRGLIGMAEGGSIFLDEIDSLSLVAQAKLLRFIQEQKYRPLGSDHFHNADVRIIAASNRDLQTLVAAKQFRADLYFRLSALQLHMAPLRERRGDIAILSKYFLEKICAQNGYSSKSLAAASLRKLRDHDWPGNVRELYNVIQRAAVFAEGPQIFPHHLFQQANAEDGEEKFRTLKEARAQLLESFERRYIEDALRESGGNVTRAAQMAGKDRRVFGRLIKRYNIQRDQL